MTRNAQCGQNATAVPQKADPMLRCGATLVWANSCRERLQQIFGNSVGRGCRERLFWVMQVADCQVEPCYCPLSPSTPLLGGSDEKLHQAARIPHPPGRCGCLL